MKERLRQIAEYNDISVREFEIKCGLKRGNIGNMSDDGTIGSDKLTKIIDTFSDINLEWLLTGRGEMLKKSEVLEQKVDSKNEEFLFFLKQSLSEKEKEIKELNRNINGLNREIGELKIKLESIEKNRLLPILSGVTIPEDTTVEKYNVNKNEVSVNEENNLKI